MELKSTVAPSAVPAAPLSVPAKPTALKKACQEFEGEFFDMMLQEMRKTVPPDPLLGDEAHQQEIFQGMMDEKVSQTMAQQSTGNSLSDMMYRQLSGQGRSVEGTSAMSQKLTAAAEPVKKNAPGK